jgi:hypothetical protein
MGFDKLSPHMQAQPAYAGSARICMRPELVEGLTLSGSEDAAYGQQFNLGTKRD